MDPQVKRALSQALRVEILERIATAPSSPRQIAERSGEPLARITYHAAVLHRTGCTRPVDSSDLDSADCVYELAMLLPPSPRLARCESMQLDRRGWEEAQAILAEAAERLAATKATAAKRLAESGEAGFEATVALAAFESAPEDPPA